MFGLMIILYTMHNTLITDCMATYFRAVNCCDSCIDVHFISCHSGRKQDFFCGLPHNAVERYCLFASGFPDYTLFYKILSTDRRNIIKPSWNFSQYKITVVTRQLLTPAAPPNEYQKILIDFERPPESFLHTKEYKSVTFTTNITHDFRTAVQLNRLNIRLMVNRTWMQNYFFVDYLDFAADLSSMSAN
ncbi:hypothetical protein HELRODRAFT_176464 [Helobdella robusta]|uniref:Uncharacterized protein n=1 Tax=Helobdella robusta TaxID=6412 RepID=T1FAJ2_HELRO|nr:hypothetical protein HELRODRAFT_176464 [Helobdella robusta]ESN99704.1 hypothetical protein HELRODRAFT_176464 [Helobdella robusta]